MTHHTDTTTAGTGGEPAVSPLVRGREREQEVLNGLLEAGRAGAALVVGAAGRGKSCLASSFCNAVTAHGGALVRTTAINRWSPPFGAFADLVEIPDTDLDVPADSRRLIRASVIAVLDDLADGSIPVLVVDDVDRLDDESAELIAELIARRRVLAVLTATSAAALPQAISDLRSATQFVEVELRDLDHPAVAAMVADRFGPSTSSTLVDQIFDLTRGVPLLVVEACRAIQEQPAPPGTLSFVRGYSADLARSDRFPVTERIIGLVDESTAALSVTARLALVLVAIAEPIGARLVRTLIEPADLVELEESGVVSVTADPVRGTDERRATLRLTTPLFGVALRKDASFTLADSHRELVAEAIEAAGARRFDDLVKIAAMRLDARGALDATILETASRRATLGYEHGLGERFARTALAQGGGVAAAYALAFSLNMQNRFDDAEVVLEQWWDEALGAEQPRVALSMVFQRTMGLHRALGRHDEAERCLDEAEAVRPDQQWRQRIRGLRAYLVGLTDARRGAEVAQDLIDDDTADEMARLFAVQATARHLATEGRTDQALALVVPYLTPSAALTRQFPRAHGFAVGLYALVQRYAGNLSDELEQSQRAIGRPPRSLDHQARGAELFRHGTNCFEVGDMQRAVVAIETGIDHLDRCDPAIWRSKALPLLASARAQIGDAVGAKDALELARDYAASQSRNQLFSAELARAEAWVAAVGGDHASGAELALVGAHGTVLLADRDELALTAWRLGATADDLNALVDFEALPAVQSPRLGVTRTHLACLATDRNARTLEASARSYEALGLMLVAAEAWIEAASEHASNPAAARRCTAHAAGILNRRCPGVVTPATLYLSAPELTRRERTVGVEAARGRTNAQIAAQLGRSVRTVEWHLQQVYRKLGVTRRRDLEHFFVPDLDD